MVIAADTTNRLVTLKGYFVEIVVFVVTLLGYAVVAVVAG